MTRKWNALSRRERQIMDIVYAHEQISALEIQAAMPDAPSYSTVRTLLKILETKGHLQHHKAGMSYIYSPVQSTALAAQSAVKQLVQTFFGSSIERLVTTLLSSADTRLTEEELNRLSGLIDQARQPDTSTPPIDEKEARP